jgi:hypothetical protein
MTEMVRAFAVKVLTNFNYDVGDIALGPVMCDRDPNPSCWWFMVGSAGTDEPFRVDQFKIDWDDKAMIERCRRGFIAALAKRRPPPRMLHDCAHELQLAQVCADTFPYDMARDFLATIKRRYGIE